MYTVHVQLSVHGLWQYTCRCFLTSVPRRALCQIKHIHSHRWSTVGATHALATEWFTTCTLPRPNTCTQRWWYHNDIMHTSRFVHIRYWLLTHTLMKMVLLAWASNLYVCIFLRCLSAAEGSPPHWDKQTSVGEGEEWVRGDRSMLALVKCYALMHLCRGCKTADYTCKALK